MSQLLRRRGACVLVLASGCIEGPEPDAYVDITPRPCESGLAPDQEIILEGTVGSDAQARLRDAPPRFQLVGPAEPIALETTVAELGALHLRPTAPLPADADLELQLVDRGGLGDVLVSSPLVPARYSTRRGATIRSHRAALGNVFISFTQPLDPSTVPGSVEAHPSFAPNGTQAMYLDAPAHMIYLNVGTASAVTIDIAPTLRSADGANVFAAHEILSLDAQDDRFTVEGCPLID